VKPHSAANPDQQTMFFGHITERFGGQVKLFCSSFDSQESFGHAAPPAQAPIR